MNRVSEGQPTFAEVVEAQTRAQAARDSKTAQAREALAAVVRSDRRLNAAVAWVRENTPELPEPIAVGAALTLRYVLRRTPTADEVRERVNRKTAA